MARPLKTGERMSVDLRIPVTPTQRELVREAMRLNQTELAAWARELLLSAAGRIVDQHGSGPKKKKRRAGESNPSADN